MLSYLVRSMDAIGACTHAQLEPLETPTLAYTGQVYVQGRPGEEPRSFL